uniref:Glycosyltransferase 2-like domain-containing protein n=1 Tax=Romanomermis culicivorax TaxID=13658 RepID=A0A915I264_ROMCU
MVCKVGSTPLTPSATSEAKCLTPRLYTFPDLDKKLANESMRKWFMNLVASDRISLDRRVPDNRFEECKKIAYNLNDLPDASVVIIFTNEAWTPLLRTVHSVANRTPRKLLREIILLDDASDREIRGHTANYFYNNIVIILWRIPPKYIVPRLDILINILQRRER